MIGERVAAPGASQQVARSNRRPGRAAVLLQQAVDALALLMLLAALLAAYHWLLSGRLILGSYDVVSYFYPYREYAARTLRSGRLPLWNPYLFAGAPFLANIQAAVFYPLNLPHLFLPTGQALSVVTLMHLYLAGAGTYLFARTACGIGQAGALVAGLAFMLGGFMSAQAGHVNQVSVAAWLPWLLLAFERAASTRRLLWAVAGAAVLSLQLLAGHTQEVYLSLLALAAFAVYLVPVAAWRHCRCWRQVPGPGRGIAAMLRGHVLTTVRQFFLQGAVNGLALGIIGGLAGLLAAVQLLPTMELSSYSIRAGGLTLAEAVSFSLPRRELALALLPGYGTLPTSNEYLAYIGAAGLALALLGALAALWRPLALFFLLLAAFSLGMALGANGPLFSHVFAVLPGMNLFRVPARWLFLYAFAVALLAAYGVDMFRPWPTRLRRLQRPLLLLACAALAGAIVAAQAWLQGHEATWALPPSAVQLRWLQAAGAAALLPALAALPYVRRAAGPMAVLIVGAELLAAGAPATYHMPTPAEALQTAPPVEAALRLPPGSGRVLSIADSSFPLAGAEARMAAIQQEFGQEAAANYLVNTKYRRIAAPNLPLAYGYATLDGYDGGVLPLRNYVTLKRLVVPPARDHPDGLLRFQLDGVQGLPYLRVLELLNVRALVKDTLEDLVVDGVRYDLTGGVVLGPRRCRDGECSAGSTAGSMLPLQPEPLAEYRIAAPAGTFKRIGLITYLEGATALSDGTPVALLTAVPQGGMPSASEDTPPDYQYLLVAGTDTAEGRYAQPNQPAPAHRQPRVAGHWKGEPQAAYYAAGFDLPEPTALERLELRYLASKGRLVVRAIALVPESGPTGSVPLVPVPTGTLPVRYDGEVRVYTIPTALPRAFVVPSVRLAAHDQQALEWLADPNFDIRRTAILPAEDEQIPARLGLRAALGELMRRPSLERLRQAVSAAAGALRARLAPRLPAGGVPGPEVWEQLRPAIPARADDPPEYRLAGNSGRSGLARILFYEPERVVVEVWAEEPVFLIMSDAFYPGWEATIDGQPVSVLRANVLLRAVAVPAGGHMVEFTYRCRPLEAGVRLSMAGLFGLLASALALAWWRR